MGLASTEGLGFTALQVETVRPWEEWLSPRGFVTNPQKAMFGWGYDLNC